MGDQPGNYDKYDDFDSYSPNPNGSSGNFMLDMLLGSFTGGGLLAPRPRSGSSVYDSYRFRERSTEFRRVMQEGLYNNVAFQSLGGLNPSLSSPTGRGFVTGLLANPDGMFARGMDPILGGNPVQAQMGLFANMTGMTNATFGKPGNISVQDSTSMMKGMYSSFYNSRKIGDTKDTGGNTIPGYATELNNEVERLQTLQTDPKVTEASKKLIKKQIEKVQKDFDNAITMQGNGIDTMYSGINYANTRGFKLQDIGSAFTSAADSFLINGKGMSESDALKKFSSSKGAMGAMDAARSLFGTSNGKDTMSEINKLVGKDSVNLLDESSGGKLEALLRKFKAVARTAGISIDAVLSINEEARRLASAYPELNHLGGVDIAEISLKAVNQASAMATVMTPRQVREAGGTQGIVSKNISTAMQRQMEPVSQQLAGAWYGLSGVNPEASADILKFINDPTSDKTASGVNSFFTQVGRERGISPNRIYSYANTIAYQQEGLAVRPEIGDIAGGEAVSQQFEKELMRYFQNPKNQEIAGVTSAEKGMEKYREESRKNGASLVKIGKTLGIDAPTMNKWTKHYSDQLNESYRMNNPNVRRFQATVGKEQQHYIDNDTEFSKTFAHLNSGILENIFQAGLTGEMRNTGMDAIRKYLSDDVMDSSPAMVAARGIGNLAQSAVLGGDEEKVDYYNSLGGAKMSKEDFGNLHGMKERFGGELNASELLNITKEQFESRKKDGKLKGVEWGDIVAQRTSLKKFLGKGGDSHNLLKKAFGGKLNVDEIFDITADQFAARKKKGDLNGIDWSDISKFKENFSARKKKFNDLGFSDEAINDDAAETFSDVTLDATVETKKAGVRKMGRAAFDRLKDRAEKGDTDALASVNELSPYMTKDGYDEEKMRKYIDSVEKDAAYTPDDREKAIIGYTGDDKEKIARKKSAEEKLKAKKLAGMRRDSDAYKTMHQAYDSLQDIESKGETEKKKHKDEMHKQQMIDDIIKDGSDFMKKISHEFPKLNDGISALNTLLEGLSKG